VDECMSLPATLRVLVTVVAPAVNATRVLAPLADNVPVTAAPPDATVTTVGVPETPMAAPVKRMSSTSTYPLLLVMARPVVPVWVSAAVFSGIRRSSARVVMPTTPSVDDSAAAPVTASVDDSAAAPVTARV